MRCRGSTKGALVLSLSALVLVLAGCRNAAAEGRLVAYDSVAAHVRQATTALRSTAGLRVQGTVRDATAKNLALDLRLTGAGDGVGLVTRNNVAGNVAVVDGSTYIRATAAWWAPDSRAESYDRTWVKAANTTVGLGFATMLRPDALGTAIGDTFTKSLPAHPPTTSLGGVAAQRITVKDSGTVLVSSAAPYRVLQIEGGFLTDGTRPVSLSLSTLPLPATSQTSRDVALLLPQLKAGSYDAQHVLQFQGTLGNNCDPAGCTITGMIHNPGSDAAVTAVLNGKLSGNKALLGRCQSPRATVSAGGTSTATCRVSTAAWRSFYANATAPGAPMATTKYQVSADASALAPAPAAVGCLSGATGCAAPEPTTAQVAASFNRSAKAWYGKPVGDDSVAAWRDLINAATASNERTPWSSLGTPTVAYLGAFQGRPFVAQFSRGDGALVSAYGPDDAEVTALREAISGRR